MVIEYRNQVELDVTWNTVKDSLAKKDVIIFDLEDVSDMGIQKKNS